MTNLLAFCNVDIAYFTIDASHDILVLTHSTGDATNVEVDDGTYSGSDMATQLQTQAMTDLSSTGITVTYDSDTKKFTINAATTGDTIAYTNTGSDAGLTFGFNADHATAVSITSNLAAGDPSTILETIRDEVEDWVENYCHKVFESASYSEYYDGNGGQYIQLDCYPVTALTRVAIGRRSAIRIQNTADYTSASVSVTTTGLVLTKDGTSDSTVTFASNTTMDAVVTAINALGSGWSAVIESSDYTNFASSELVEMFGKNAIDDNWVYLYMPDEAIDDFEVYPNRGELYRSNGWIEGNRNIYVKYTAGYSSTTMPKDLQLAIKIMSKYIYQKREEDIFGTKEFWAGDTRAVLEDGDVPKEALNILSRFRRILI